MRFIVALMLYLVPATANAGNVDRPIIGVGNQPCDLWLTAPSEKALFVLKSWVQGFLSATNQFSDQDFLKQTNATAIYAWVDNYCRQNPDNLLGTATEALIAELSKRARGN